MSISYEGEREYNQKLLDWIASPPQEEEPSISFSDDDANSNLVDQAVGQAMSALCLDELAWPEELALRTASTKGKLFWLLVQLYNENKCPCIVWVLDRALCEVLAVEFASYLNEMYPFLVWF
jgi:hypothetical protein